MKPTQADQTNTAQEKNSPIPWFRSLTFRLLASILILLTLFALLIGQWTGSKIEQLLHNDARTEAVALARTQIVGLKTLMLNGDGLLTSEWLSRVEGIEGIGKIQIYRRNGDEAFTDLTTINDVNHYLGNSDAFKRKELAAHPDNAPDLQKVLQAAKGETLISDDTGKFSLLMPIKLEQSCLRCHGYDDNPVRGVFYIQLATQTVESRIADLREKALIFSVIFALVLLISVWSLLHGLLFKPMDLLLSSIRRLRHGTLNKSTLPTKRRDEFGALAREFEELETSWAIRERRLHLILQHIPDGILTVDQEGRVLSLNQAAQKMFNKPAEDILHQNILTQLYPPSRAVRDNIKSLSEVGLHALAETLRECVGQSQDGSLFPIELEVCPFNVDYMMFMRERAVYDLDEHGSFLIFLRDLSVRKRAEGEMRLLSSVVNQASDAILITDYTGKIQYVNNAFYRITQYPREEVIGKTPRILKSGEYGQEYYSRMWEDLLAGKVWKDVFTNRRKDSSTYQAEQTIAPMFDSYGNVSHFVSIQRDISKERDMQKQIEHLQRLESLGVLASGIAHDFNNILAVVIGNADLLAMTAGEAEKKSLDAITLAGSRGAGLCRELMAYAGKGKHELKWINVKDLLSELNHLLQITIPKHINIIYELEESLPRIRADTIQIEQIIMNLLINAREAIDEQPGTITVTGKRVQVTKGWFDHAYFDQLPEELDFVQLTVSDNGCGMTEAVMARVFDPFYTTKFTGRGLGMSAALGIIKSHQGAIRCQSTVGEGTTFTILLPHCNPQQEEEKDELQSNNKETSTPDSAVASSILLVEDETAILDVLKKLLEHAGHQVYPYTNGNDALQFFKKHQHDIDLVSLDMSMPGMNGPELLQQLRANGLSCPVVVCSGEPKDDVLKKLGALQVDEIISKPFQYQGILQSITALLRR